MTTIQLERVARELRGVGKKTNPDWMEVDSWASFSQIK